MNVKLQSCFHTPHLEMSASRIISELKTCVKYLLLPHEREKWEKIPSLRLQASPQDSQPCRFYTCGRTALFSGGMTGGKWHLVIWHESNGFEARLEDMNKDLAPSAGSPLIACMTKSDLISRSVWHFKSQKVKVLDAQRERERRLITGKHSTVR